MDHGVILASSAWNEDSWEIDGGRNSYFTYYVLEGLDNNTADDGDPDGFVSIEELYNYSQSRVYNAVLSDKGKVQTVQLGDNYSGELDITAPITLSTWQINVIWSETSTNFTIENKGGNGRSWSITSYPAWITSISPSSGTLSAGQIQTITINFDQNSGNDRSGVIDFSYFVVEETIQITQFSHVTTSGSLSSNETWRNTVTITGNVTIPNGIGLTILDNTEIQFDGGTFLTVNGTLYGDNATFKRSGASAWNGIQFQSGSGGSLDGCAIRGGTYGVYCNYAAPTIENCTFLYNGYALYLYNASPSVETNSVTDDVVYLNTSNAYLYDNYFTNSSGSYCLEMYNSSPDLFQNTISGAVTIAVLANNGSLPFFGDTASLGYNYLYNNNGDWTLAAANNSNPVLGKGPDTGPYVCGNNSIISGPQNNAHAAVGNNSEIDAMYCYWGQYPAPSLGDDISTDFALSSDPGGGSSLAKALWTDSYSDNNDPIVCTTHTKADSLWNVGIDLYRSKNLQGAIPVFKTVIQKYPASPQARKSLFKLLWIGKELGNLDMCNLWEEMIANTPDTEIKAVMKDRLVGSYRKARRFQDALDLSLQIKKQYPDTEHEYTALFDLFNLYQKDLNDLASARSVLEELKQKYPDCELTLIAQFDFGEDVEGALAKNPAFPITKDIVSNTIPADFNLGHNYPNPFNPTTVIPFDLPEKAHVTLMVYDITGREVVTLVDGEQTAGYRTVQWNGKDRTGMPVPNGVYIYTLKANSFNKSAKMILLK